MLKTTLATSVAMLAFAAAPAAAANVVALAGDNELVWVDTEAMKATGSSTIQGVDGRLLGIDVRPANGMLYGLFADGTIATINAETGEATSVSTITTMLPEGAMATVDFNPAADRLRVMGSDGTSLRINVETGETTKDGSHAYAEGDTTPNVVAGAYTNSYAGTESTQLFNIDGAAGWLVLQNPPNDGVLNAVGEIGMNVTEAGFDIASDGEGGNEAWLMNGDTLYSVNLETGAATEAGKVEGVTGTVRDIAIMPAM